MDIQSIVLENGWPKPDFLANLGLKSILVYDVFRIIEADWLSRALNSLDGSKKFIEAYVYDSPTVSVIRHLPISKHAMFNFVNENNTQNLLIIDKRQRFIIYFSKYREFYLLCGSYEFLTIAYPISFETVKDSFFQNVDLEAEREPIDKDYYQQLWDMYS